MSQNNDFQEALTELYRSIDYMVDQKIKQNSTLCYSGVVSAQNSDGTWQVSYNGKSHAVSQYGSNTPTVGSMVKVFIPQGNQNLAFFI